MTTDTKYLVRVFAVKDHREILEDGFAHGKGHGGVFQPDSLTCFIINDKNYVSGDIADRIKFISRINTGGHVVVGLMPLNDDVLRDFRGLWQVGVNFGRGEFIERLDQVALGGKLIVEKEFLSAHWCSKAGAEILIAVNTKPLEFAHYTFNNFRDTVESQSRTQLERE